MGEGAWELHGGSRRRLGAFLVLAVGKLQRAVVKGGAECGSRYLD